MDSHRQRSTLHRLSVVWPMNDNHEGPVPPGDGATVCRQHAVHDVLIDGDPKRSRDDARNPWTAESRIPRRELDDGLDKCLARPLRSGFLRALARREQSAVFATHQRLMKRQERRGAYADGDLSDSSWAEEKCPESEQQPVTRCQAWRSLARTAQADQLLLEQKILCDHRSHATGATQRRGHDGQVKQGEQEGLHVRDSVGQTSGATQRGLKPGCSERIGNSRRTGRPARPLPRYAPPLPSVVYSRRLSGSTAVIRGVNPFGRALPLRAHTAVFARPCVSRVMHLRVSETMYSSLRLSRSSRIFFPTRVSTECAAGSSSGWRPL